MTVKRLGMLGAALLVGGGYSGAVPAQFGMNLPRNDFTWTWGDSIENIETRLSDLSANGSEGGFNCDLTAKLRPGSRYTPSDVRQVENDLRVSLYFIQETANMMNLLDQRREIDWAVLDCKRPQQADPDSEKVQERLERQRQRMIEEQRRRREREE